MFGPHPRDYRVRIPQTIRREAVLESLEAKWRAGKMTVVKDFSLEAPKTRMMRKALAALQVQGGVLILVDGPDATLLRAARNLPRVSVQLAREATAYDILACRNLIVSEAGWKTLQQWKG